MQKKTVKQNEWIPCKERLPEKYTWVEVKAKPFPKSTAPAILVDTEWDTTNPEWLYCGMISMAVDLVTEWRMPY